MQRKYLKLSICVVLFIHLLFHSFNASSQFNSEFAYYDNGLIYSDSTMDNLHAIVNKLNLKHKRCSHVKQMYAVKQGTGHFIEIYNDDTGKVIKDFNSGISFESFIYKYPGTKWNEDNYVILNPIISKRGVALIEAISIESANNSSIWLRNNLEDVKVKNKWIYRVYGSNIYAFYMTSDFKQPKIPERYSRCFQYVDCLIDTNSSVFSENAGRSGGLYDLDDTVSTPRYRSLLNYLDNSKDKLAEKGYENDTVFQKLLVNAFNEALKKGRSNERLELLAEKHYGKDAALRLMRNRIVVGMCSEDYEPRLHVLKIATLSAELMNWDIFLRAHLDIMNDNFSRLTDGSYAWSERKTYIKELEILGINMVDLMTGLALRIQKSPKNHYTGSVHRLGRALSEVDNKDEVETALKKGIQDMELDPFNRLSLLYLYKNYVTNLSDKQRSADALKELPSLYKFFPKEISNSLHRY